MESGEAATAWWEWPFVVVLLPLRWCSRGLEIVADAAIATIDSASRAVARVCDLVVARPLRALGEMLTRPVRWLGRVAWSVVRAPAALLAAAGRSLGRGLAWVLGRSADALALVLRPVAVLVEHVLGRPVRFAARTLQRSWWAGGRLAARIWRAFTALVRKLARTAGAPIAGPVRRVKRRAGLLWARIGARTARRRP